jgi:N-acetylneuraminate synthase/N,N'-diacetyllegionaminate synthase
MNIYIGNKKVGNKSPCFIIAEAGVNHNGDVNLAKQLILKAKEVGADCVKFQTFKAEQVVTPNAPKAMYQLKNTNPRESQIAMLKKLELSSESYYELIQLCKKIDIVFMSTPYNYEDVEFLERLNVCAYKLPSISIVEPSFLEYVANKNKPMIVSTGMATLNEVSDGVRTIITSGNKKLIILHCTTNYPTALSDANLNAMKTMGDRLNVLFGYSDHVFIPVVYPAFHPQHTRPQDVIQVMSDWKAHAQLSGQPGYIGVPLINDRPNFNNEVMKKLGLTKMDREVYSMANF